MVDQIEVCPNRAKFSDSFDFVPKPASLNTPVLRDWYENQGLTCTQIAERMGVSRPMVSSLLAQAGIKIRPAPLRSNQPDNYRRAQPPFGYRVQGGRLVECLAERLVCALIVQRFIEGRSSSWIAAELGRLGHKNRRGSTDWHHWSVTQIDRRWKNQF